MLAVGLSMAVVSTSAAKPPSYAKDVDALFGHDGKAARRAATSLSAGGPEAVSELVRQLPHRSHSEQTAILQMLSGISRRGKSALAKESDITQLGELESREADRSLRYHYVEAIGHCGGGAAVEELKRVASTDSEERIRYSATHLVGTLTNDDVAFFKKQLTDKSAPVRLAAAFEMARRGDASGREIALKALTPGKDSFQTYPAIATLGEIGNPRDIPALEEVVADHSASYGTKRMASNAIRTIKLLQIPPESRLDALMKDLDDDNEAVRSWAYSRLWNLPDPTTSSRLKTYMSESGHKGYKEASNALSARKEL
jgi:HEAT repeat protein